MTSETAVHEPCWCGKPWPTDGYADEALCFGPDGRMEAHDHQVYRPQTDAVTERTDYGNAPAQ
jgi:hypothetical protein